MARREPPRRATAAWISLGLLLGSAGCGDEGTPPANAKRPNVLLVTLDTTRRDIVGFQGASPSPTPNLDRLAAESLVFDDAYAVAPLTLPSHASILTGLYPVSLGVHDNALLPIPSAARTLPERLGEVGYHTGAAVAAFVLDRDFGTAQGFERFSAPPRTPIGRSVTITERSAEEMVDVALADLEGLSEPFFYWLHLYDPHFPYTGKKQFPTDPLSPEGRRQRYREEVFEADAQLGRLFARLRERGLWDELVVVFAADHGECVGDGHESSHGRFVFDETVRIPLSIKIPGREPGRRATQVSQIDVTPTLLSLLGLPLDGPFDGVDLAPVLDGGDLAPRVLACEAYDLYLQHGWAPSEAVVQGPFKYLHTARSRLLDRSVDPRETGDATDQHPQIAERLRGELERIFATPAHQLPPDPKKFLDGVDREKLQAMGYAVGSTLPRDARPADFSALEDAELRRSFLESLDNFFFALGEKDSEAALDGLRKMAQDEPDSSNVHELLGTFLLTHRPDRLDEAEDHLRRAIELQPALAKVHFNLSLCAQRRMDAAEKGAARLEGEEKEKALDTRDRHRQTMDLELRQALALEPRYPEALLNLSVVETQIATDLWRGGELEAAHERFAAALDHLQQYLEVVPEDHEDHQKNALLVPALQSRVDRTRLGLPMRDG